MPRSLAISYAVVATLLAGVCALLVAVVHQPPPLLPVDADSLLRPVVVLVATTFVVLVLTAVVRNVAVIRGTASLRYYQSYAADGPEEWIERPARTYMNLLELPVLFYAAVALMVATHRFDHVQVSLAWVFVATRIVHAAVYVALNRVPYRFAAFVSGVITLGVLWVRFGEQVW